MKDVKDKKSSLHKKLDGEKIKKIVSKIDEIEIKILKKIFPKTMETFLNGDYDEKIALCEKFGANKFQKVVFKVEDLKFKAIKKFCPRFIEHYDKYCDKRRDKKLKKAKTEEEQKQIIKDYRNLKLVMRKELNREQNRNYHMDQNKPAEILFYLNWNKSVHKTGIIKNVVTIPIIATATIIGVVPFGAIVGVPLIAMETAGLFINFQCVNIQNCNIYRFKKREEIFQKMHERKIEKNMEKYGEGAEAIDKTYQETKEIPSIETVTDNTNRLEELRELRRLIKDTKKTNNTIANQKKIGGK